MATAPVIKANKNEISYAIANITLFGIYINVDCTPILQTCTLMENSLFARTFFRNLQFMKLLK